MSKKQMGFTLIEIVMVLVLLGILSAVAVPKYFDLRDQAAQKSAQAIAAEAQARINGAFANSLMAGNNCTTARTTAIGEITTNKFKADGMTDVSLGTADANGLAVLSFKINGNSYSSSATDSLLKIQSIAVPVCSTIATNPTPTE